MGNNEMKRMHIYKFFSVLFSYPEKTLFGDEDVSELQKEYVRLFITAKPLPCPPYESVYRD